MNRNTLKGDTMKLQRRNHMSTSELEKSLSSFFSTSNDYPVSYQPYKSGTFFIDILENIESPSQFSNAVQVLRSAEEDDTVVIDLQCNGGSLDATDRFVHAMRACKCPIHVIATGCVASAATVILLEGDSFELSEGFSALIHNGSTGASGKFSDFKSSAAFTTKYFEKFLQNTYEGFLTQAEITDVLKGVDIWLDGEEWLVRHNTRNEFLKEKMEVMKSHYEAMLATPEGVMAQALIDESSIEDEEMMFMEKAPVKVPKKKAVAPRKKAVAPRKKL